MKIEYKPQLEFTEDETFAIIELLKIANNVITEFENSDYVSERDYKDWITTRNLLKEIIRQRLWRNIIESNA